MRTDPFRHGTPMKTSNRNAMLRYCIRKSKPDDMLEAVMRHRATKATVYGFHPTKKRTRVVN